MNKYDYFSEEEQMEFLEKEREYKPLERFSDEYFKALTKMDHPRHKEAMAIRAKYNNPKMSLKNDGLKLEDVVHIRDFRGQ